MTARRIAAVAVRIALGVAVLAAVSGVAWAAGATPIAPNASHVLRIAFGFHVVVSGVFLTCCVARVALDIGDAIVNAWRERRR